MAALWVLFGVAGSSVVQAGEAKTQKESAAITASMAGKPSDFSRILPGRRVPGTPKGAHQTDGAKTLKPSDPRTTSSATAPPGVEAQAITNIPICVLPANQVQPVGIRDGGGGYIVAWSDYRSGTYDIYAQKLDAAGIPQWAANGVPVYKGVTPSSAPKMTSDGLGGAIVVWQDSRNGNLDVYGQRLGSSGAQQWASGGVAICSATGDQRLAEIVSDGTSGAIVVWEDDRVGGSDIYAQRVNDLGAVQWTANGVALCTATGNQQAPVLVTDQLSGAIVAWQDFRSGGPSDIYVRRVNSSGTPQWTADGVAICTATGTQELPSIASDGAGGAIVGWDDARNPANGLDVYVQRVNASGSPQWTADGVVLVTMSGDQDRPKVVSDAAGGAVTAWRDLRSGTSSDVYARRVDAAGNPMWTAGGVAVCTAVQNQFDVIVVPDNGNGGAFVAWSDDRAGPNPPNNDIYVQRLDTAGNPLWTANGVLLCDSGNNQDQPSVVADGVGGAFVLWRDFRNAVNYDIYGQRVDPTGQLPDQCSPPVDLVSGTGITAAGPTNNYTFNQNEFFWTAVGVRANTANDDWDIEIYGPYSYGGQPYPTCFSDAVAGSYRTAGKVDVVAGDFNGFHVPPDIYQARAFRYSGSGTATVEWDDGGNTSGGNSDILAVNDNQFVHETTDASDVLKCWDVDLISNATYTFQFRRTGGTADTKLLLFNANGSLGCQVEDCFYFAPRSEAKVEASQDFVYTCPPYTQNSNSSNGWHGVVVVNDNGQSGSYDLKVLSGVLTGVGESAPTRTGLKSLVPNPARGDVQIQFRLGEPGGVSFEVFDMAGRTVSGIPSRFWAPGNWSQAWNGKGADGKALPPGLYFVQMKLGDRVVGLSRVTLLR
jgi:predicted lipoprotein with Yx(FWY)xxD motif